jgi:hypothetical protein
VFSMGPPRDCISSTQQNENQNGASPRQTRRKGSAEDSLLVTVIYCDKSDCTEVFNKSSHPIHTSLLVTPIKCGNTFKAHDL